MHTAQLSANVLFAGLGATAVGLLHSLVSVWHTSGGGFRTIFRGARDRSSALWIIIGVDAISGVGLGFAIALAGASQPEALFAYVDEHQVLGWLAIGIVGPFIADRIFAGSVIKDRFSGWLDQPDAESEDERPGDNEIQAQAWRLRREAVRAIDIRCWVIVQRRLSVEARRLRARAERMMAENPARLIDLVRLCRARRQLPPTVLAALSRFTPEISFETRIALLDALVEELIQSQTWDPLEVLFGDAGEVGD